ncbi:relaxase/mobilization nuclease domain-containing protein [Gordonibacter sp. ResAG-59]|uniref:Relaxase/mobilization nuclease domain-containing protein n=2 Tax=Gordonibacter urolithinfaciens TaxID=1335613 RepID=A0A6N8III4_9ACTN|nr:relaxase/mobilization nuclease domain-containing protein [Gordonibacter urolithinfaciens]MVN40307.1 relaxase/mobilization nuclease domain-containing protein [Gordonibacter urolithinfaciens]MVN60952.1 relaxase/mobilization nuclease domain-containing protein [Gordonibacter urolithinfaciens]
MAMPILKQIAGHGSCARLQRYLEKNGRALARDLFNFDGVPEPDHDVEPDPIGRFDWAGTMDRVRKEEGNDLPWKGKEARTFKHFVLSPSPADGMDLRSLRELSQAWVRRFFPDYHVAIVYHDDNEGRIPHAHIVVNNTNVVTGRRMHTDDPLELNRTLQEMAAKRGLDALSNERPKPRTGFQRLSSNGTGAPARPRTLQETYRGRAERRAEETGGYSWVADIRSRVSVAKNLARSEREFRRILGMMGVDMEDNSPHARRQDWVFSLSDAPARRVSGERLGASYGKAALERRLVGARVEHLTDASSRELLRLARKAVELKDLGELDSLSRALETCSRWGIASVDGIDRTIAAQRRRLGNGVPATRERAILESLEALGRARAFLTKSKALPLHDASRKVARGNGKGGWKSDPTTPSQSTPTQERELDARGGRQR